MRGDVCEPWSLICFPRPREEDGIAPVAGHRQSSKLQCPSRLPRCRRWALRRDGEERRACSENHRSPGTGDEELVYYASYEILSPFNMLQSLCIDNQAKTVHSHGPVAWDLHNFQ